MCRRPLESPVEDVMVRSCLCTINPDVTIAEAAERMSLQGSTALVISDGLPLGIVTEDHMIDALAAERNPAQTRVEEIMTAIPLPAISRHSTVYDALAAMMRNKTSALPVRDCDKLAGLVTIRQIFPYWSLEPRT